MDFIDLEDEFDLLDLHVRQAQLLQEFIIDGDSHRRAVLDDLMTEVLNHALEDVERFGNLLQRYSQESRDGNSLTSAAPITSTAPMIPGASIRSRSSSAESSTATTGSM